MVRNKPNLTILKHYLKQCSKEELISDISEIFQKFQPVRNYYQVKLSPQDKTAVSTKYKKIIEDEFFPKRGYGKAKLSVAKKAVLDYKKISGTPASVADIMIFYVEQGVKFTSAYGDIDESFYNSMESMYEKAIDWVVKYDIQGAFEERCRRIVEDTSGMGWEFHEGLSHIYSDVFDNG
jgi:Family of unknown function (DUF6155)